MGDISTWSPVDESNTMPVPNGWPEGQATNTVNNCARAMQGAVRRWYDTITAQLASLTASLANYLPLTGGTLSGPISATYYQLDGMLFAARDAAGGIVGIYDGDGVISVQLGGAAAGYVNYYKGGAHHLQSNDGAVTFATFTAAGLGVPTLVDTGQYRLLSTLLASRSGDGGHQIFDGSGQLALALYSGANHYRANSHVWQNNTGAAVALLGDTGTFSVADIIASGGVTTAGISTGGISASGGITAAGNISGNVITGATVNSNNHIAAAGNINATGNVTGGTLTGNHLQSNGNIDAAGDIGCNDLGATGNITAGGNGNVTGTLTAGAFSSNQMTAANLDAGDIDCTGNCDAASYTRGGVPMVMLTQQQFDQIEARLALLETLAMKEPA